MRYAVRRCTSCCVPRHHRRGGPALQTHRGALICVRISRLGKTAAFRNEAAGDSPQAHSLCPGVAHTWRTLTRAPAVQGHVRHNERVSLRRSRLAARLAGSKARRSPARRLNPGPHSVAAAAGEPIQLEQCDVPHHAMILRSLTHEARCACCLAGRL